MPQAHPSSTPMYLPKGMVLSWQWSWQRHPHLHRTSHHLRPCMRNDSGLLLLHPAQKLQVPILSGIDVQRKDQAQRKHTCMCIYIYTPARNPLSTSITDRPHKLPIAQLSLVVSIHDSVMPLSQIPGLAQANRCMTARL